MTNFMYDSQFLSDYGFVVCKFETGGSLAIDKIGTTITFEKTSKNNGSRFGLASAVYKECVSAEFDICKNPDLYDDDMGISEDERKNIVRWLNRREFLLFQPIDDCDGEHEQKFYNASFNISKIESGGILYGFRLKMETDSPFCYGRERCVVLDYTNGCTERFVRDDSDEIGFLYPNVTITCCQNGTVSLHNLTEGCKTVIKNCFDGEIITIDGENQIIQTSAQEHAVMNDFNFEFPRIGNSRDNRVNRIVATAPCIVEFKYRPVIKDIP